MKKLLGFMEPRFHLDPKKYSNFFKLCVRLTNYHVSLMPLHCNNGAVKCNYNCCIQDQMKQVDNKCKAQQERSRATRKAYLDANAQSVDKDGELLDLGNSNQWLHSAGGKPNEE